MSFSTNQTSPFLSSIFVPTVADVDAIAKLTDPVNRNLQITQCYYELSAVFVKRGGPYANWCTFATWASKQAGQTIRREDLKRRLEDALKIKPEVEQALSLIANLARELGAQKSFDEIRQSV